MRPIWKGSISFGLVNIPVALYAASKPANEIKFRLLRDSDSSPVRYKRIAEVDDKEVPWKNVVKGYEYEKDEFVVLREEDFKRVDLKSKQVVEIQEFVELSEIDPMFFDKPYYLVPEKNGEKAYALLREALNKSNKVGIAKVVLHTREHLAAVKPQGRLLVLELMHFGEELMTADDFSLPKTEVGKKELGMAETLIDSMSDKWDPANYKDEYRAALMKVIEQKIKAGGKELPAQKGRRPLPANVVDIVEVLQKSLAESERKKGKQPKGTAGAKPGTGGSTERKSRRA